MPITINKQFLLVLIGIPLESQMSDRQTTHILPVKPVLNAPSRLATKWSHNSANMGMRKKSASHLRTAKDGEISIIMQTRSQGGGDFKVILKKMNEPNTDSSNPKIEFFH